MKKFLVILNCFLGVLLFVLLISCLAKLTKKEQAYEVKKRSGKKVQTQDQSKRTKLVIEPEKQVETIVNADIFNPERAPNVSAWGRGRTQISLVGTFKVGKVEGAIILQQVSNRMRNPLSRMGAMMSQEAMMQMMQRPAGQQASGQNANAARRPMGSMRQRWSMLNPQLAQQLAAQNGAGTQTAIKQYVRVGETLANGYTLTEVTRTKAVLSKGGDKMELELQDPSKNQTQRSSTARRGNSWREFQQTQIRTQQQMLRMMYMMQSRMNSGGGGGGRGGRR
ncbi:MAG: hypothetical protein IKC65_00835 [Lentisphaeria bacterium]|nr:hypothetical protein [Lentisphaeria bacterium]